MTPEQLAHPKRIQRKRTKGWKMPEGAVYVGRPTKWGNPYRMSESSTVGTPVEIQRHNAVADFRDYREYRGYPPIKEICAELRGKDLACWCRLDQPCHADVLLEIANAGESQCQP